MSVPGLEITEAGISGPSYPEILEALQNEFYAIYGSDANLGADTQDGQFIAVFAQSIYAAQQSAIAVYNAFSPLTAQGVGLSSIVKLNGLTRQIPTNSQCIVTLIGHAGATIADGLVGDNLNLNTQWALPASVTIPDSGTIQVTATCTTEGATAAAAGSLTEILTPTLGWQTVTNASAATEGNPVESDATLRLRQTASTSLPALSVIDSIYAAVASISGVSRLKIYENDGDAVDADGITAHSIAVVVEGGDAQEIADTIALKKTPGTGTDGDVEEQVIDERGVPSTIRFYDLDPVPLEMEITIQALTGYTSAIGVALQANVVDFVNALEIGEDSYLSRLFSPANLGGTGDGATYVVLSIEQSRDGDPIAPSNVTIAFNEAATLAAADLTLTVV